MWFGQIHGGTCFSSSWFDVLTNVELRRCLRFGDKAIFVGDEARSYATKTGAVKDHHKECCGSDYDQWNQKEPGVDAQTVQIRTSARQTGVFAGHGCDSSSIAFDAKTKRSQCLSSALVVAVCSGKVGDGLLAATVCFFNLAVKAIPEVFGQLRNEVTKAVYQELVITIEPRISR